MTEKFPNYGPLDLLVLQPTPFCNINCSYCYLPDRLSRKRMPMDVLEKTMERVFASGLVQRELTMVWHAGEPFVVGTRFYKHALAVVARYNHQGVPIVHSFQTNGTLIDEEWCAFIKAHDLRIGVSVDGPEFLHDRCRRTYSGKGTFQRVMRGIGLLQKHEIPFHVISVLTRDSLLCPDELYDFYCENGIISVGFNVEEIEGPNQTSSLTGQDTYTLYTAFLQRFFDLTAAGAVPLQVREFDTYLGLLQARAHAGPLRTQEATPLAILSVDCEGNFTTFSPELLGLKSDRYGDFVIGRIQTDSIIGAMETEKFRAISRDIQAGVRRCQETCSYFKFCGGGAPVNKYFENGTFDSTETLFCRLGRQAVMDVVLDKLEQHAAGQPQERGTVLPMVRPPSAPCPLPDARRVALPMVCS
jgi:uncharacterized protein